MSAKMAILPLEFNQSYIERSKCPYVEMDRPKPQKHKGGAAKLREKKLKSLQVDAAKCAKITNMFASTNSTAAAVPSTSSAAVPGA